MDDLGRRVRRLRSRRRVVREQLETASRAGWSRRSPRRRAATSVPKRHGTFKPAARAPRAHSVAAASRPTPSTISALSIVIEAVAAPCGTFGGCAGGAGAGGGGGGAGSVTVVVVVGSVTVGSVVVCVGSVTVGSVVVGVGSVTVGSGCGGVTGGGGGGGGGARSCFRSKTRFASAWFVSSAFGWNVAGDFVPIRPTCVTTRICGSAHELERRVACVRAAGQDQRKSGRAKSYPTTSRQPRPHKHFTLEFVEIEITPEPSEDERAAILAVLAEVDGKPAPAPWVDEEIDTP